MMERRRAGAGRQTGREGRRSHQLWERRLSIGGDGRLDMRSQRRGHGPWNSELLQYEDGSRRPATMLHLLYSDASKHGISYRSERSGIIKCSLAHGEMVRCLSVMLNGVQDGTRHETRPSSKHAGQS